MTDIPNHDALLDDPLVRDTDDDDYAGLDPDEVRADLDEDDD